MKVTCKKTGKDMTSKVINQIEKSLEKSGYKIISKSPYRNEKGEYKMWTAFHSGDITI